MGYVLLATALIFGCLVASLFLRDAWSAAQYTQEPPAVLAEELEGPSPLSVPTETGAISSENAPREERDPSAALTFEPFTPARIYLPDAGVNTTVEPRPATEQYNRFLDAVVPTFPVPEGPFTTVWWNEGPMPGADGLAIVLGHARTPRDAVFNGLPHLEPGAAVGLTGTAADGREVAARYAVQQVVSGISKTDAAALRAVLDAPPAGATLALITCSGELEERLSSRTDNTVVFASLEAMYPAKADG